MDSMVLRGNATIDGGEYATLKVEGMARCAGNIKAAVLDVDGVLNCEGAVEAEVIQCDGVGRFDGGVRAGRFEADGSVTLKCLTAEDVSCDGLIQCEGDISAGTINAGGAVSADRVEGGKVTIRSFRSRYGGFAAQKTSEIGEISAAFLNLSGVHAREAAGQVVRVGPGCRIGRVDCSATLYVHEKAEIGMVAGKHERREYTE